jgi:hypothetical protein
MKLLHVIVLLAATPLSFAGQSGQQISFRTPGADLERVRISGDNQQDTASKWDSSWKGILCSAGRCDQARTDNWWFKGKVVVRYRLRNDHHTYSCYFYVNEQQPGDWVRLSAPNVEADGPVFRYRKPGKAPVKCAAG